MQPLTPTQVTQIRRLISFARNNLSVVYAPPHLSYDGRIASYDQFVTDLNEIDEQMDVLKDEYAEVANGLKVEMVNEPPEEPKEDQS